MNEMLPFVAANGFGFQGAQLLEAQHRITGRRTGTVNRHLGIGWEFVHVCIDGASRVTFVQVMPDERRASAAASWGPPSPIMPSWASGSSP
ncbi:hypothetical protein [Mesorhizobium sp.]|uniref:hypothetical protein n=1 Tax=Mesorhizobium sp. TaxID=1871066 RepID=UPI0025F2852D|nr:hypothetical protein [Mesorhizobium sp.]